MDEEGPLSDPQQKYKKNKQTKKPHIDSYSWIDGELIILSF